MAYSNLQRDRRHHSACATGAPTSRTEQGERHMSTSQSQTTPYPQGQAQQWPAPAPVQYVVQPQASGSNGFAVASMIFGLLGGGLLAIIFGHIALSQLKRNPQGGRGMAVTGLVLGYLGLAVYIIVIIALAAAASSGY
jgi:hypothetical protein